jgi:hypothetical protein
MARERTPGGIVPWRQAGKIGAHDGGARRRLGEREAAGRGGRSGHEQTARQAGLVGFGIVGFGVVRLGRHVRFSPWSGLDTGRRSVHRGASDP